MKEKEENCSYSLQRSHWIINICQYCLYIVSLEVTGVKQHVNPLPHYNNQENNCEAIWSYRHSFTIVHYSLTNHLQLQTDRESQFVKV